jgi:hypothetical protein
MVYAGGFVALLTGGLSDYQRVEDGALYAFEGGFADTAQLHFIGQITDHVGDRPLPHGRYTYAIAVTPELTIQETDGSIFFFVR